MDARSYHDATNHSPSNVHASAAMDPENKPRPSKRYRGRRRVDLDSIAPPWDPLLSVLTESEADPLVGTARSIRPPLDRETVATLCYEATGITSRVNLDGRDVRFRAASCTGKLYHVDCYLVCGDLPDLPAGVYHFDPETMSLDVVREGEYRGVVARAAGASSVDGSQSGGVADAPLTVIATSNWWRNAWKYGDRTYRHAFWDSGTILANLLAAAHGLDLRAAIVTAFAEDPLVDLLGLDPAEEAPLALAPIGTEDPAPDPASVDPIDPATEPSSPDPRTQPHIEAAWRASTLADGDVTAWRDRALTNRGIGRVSAGEGDRIPLDPVDHETASARPLHPTVVRRGSCREFADAGPSRRQVGTVLDRATRGIPGDWNDGHGDGLDYLDAYVLATGVDGVPDGTYQYHPDDASLERLDGVDRESKTHLALDQGWAGDAHVNVYLLADVDAIVDALGDRGYRLAQLEAGLTLGRLYLATYAHRSLGGTGLTFYDDEVSDHLSPRAATQTPMTLFGFGRRPLD